MDNYELAALADFVASVVWPSRTVAIATSNQTDFPVLGTWDTVNDVAIAWINGQRYAGAITWLSASEVELADPVAAGAQVIIYVSPGAGTGYLPRTGLAAMLGKLNMATFQIENLGASTQGHHAVRRDEVLALATSLLGANYLLKTGGQMAGGLLLRAANLITGASEAVRRDMVALLNGSQPFTGKQAGVSTVDGDAATTLTTKDFVLSKVASAAANYFPNQQAIYTTPGTYTLDLPAGATRAWVYVKGANGGQGGESDNPSGGAPGPGGKLGWSGGLWRGVMAVAGQLAIVVGGAGGTGANSTSGGDGGGGGGGGGGSRVQDGTNKVVGGGGGGGSGERGASGDASAYGGAGGAAATAGGLGGGSNAGGSAGSGGITEAGGLGDTGWSSPDAHDGTIGSTATAGTVSAAEAWAVADLDYSTLAAGAVAVRWFA
jgi:hypothetical protein